MTSKLIYSIKTTENSTYNYIYIFHACMYIKYNYLCSIDFLNKKYWNTTKRSCFNSYKYTASQCSSSRVAEAATLIRVAEPRELSMARSMIKLLPVPTVEGACGRRDAIFNSFMRRYFSPLIIDHIRRRTDVLLT